MTQSIYLVAILALMCLFEAQDVATAEQSPAPSKPAGARDQPAATTPESVLKEFLTAMVENDAAGVRRTALPHPELSVLWHSEPLTAAQKAIAKAELNPSNFRRLKVGDAMPIPGGPKNVLDKQWINERRLAITMPDGPLPFLLVKIKDEWKVDASPLIAARNAAAAVEERNKAAGLANWIADPKLLDQLAQETTIDGWSFRPPAGYRPVKVTIPGAKTSGWRGTPRKDGSVAWIEVIVIPADDTSRPLSHLLDLAVASLEPERKMDWRRSPVELGKINNVLCARLRWSGAPTKGRKDLIGKKLQGVVYLLGDGTKFVEAMLEAPASDDAKSLPLCEASALTLRRVPDKH